VRIHSRRVKNRSRGGSRKLRGGNFLRQAGQFLGFGRSPQPNPADAQAQMVQAEQNREVADHQQSLERKQQEASALREQCQDYQRIADQLDQEAADHMNAAEEIARNREERNRCDQEHAMRLEGIEQDYQQRLAELTQQHNVALSQENQRAQEQHKNCLRDGMRLSNQQPERRDQAALDIQRRFRGVQGRSAADAANAADLDQAMGMVGGRKSRRRHRRKSRRHSRKSRRHSRKSRRHSRKSRRGGGHCGPTHKKKKMYAGRKSRRGGAHCSPNSGKKCPYYKKHGYHKYGYHM